MESVNIIIEMEKNYRPCVYFKMEIVVQGLMHLFNYDEKTAIESIKPHNIYPYGYGEPAYIDLWDLYSMVVDKDDCIEKYELSALFVVLYAMGVVKPLAILLAKFAIKEYKAEVLED